MLQASEKYKYIVSGAVVNRYEMEQYFGLHAKPASVLHQFVYVFFFGRHVLLHCRTHNLNVAATAAQDVAQRPFKVIDTDGIAAGRHKFGHSMEIMCSYQHENDPNSYRVFTPFPQFAIINVVTDNYTN